MTPMKKRAAVAVAFACLMAPAQAQDDPYLWLEEIDSARALEWVQAQNRLTQPALEATPGFEALRQRLLGILTSRERIPVVVQRGGYLYNFWQDATHPRGVLRRTTLPEYRQREPKWETVLDVNRLAAEEKLPWVYKGIDCLAPQHRRCLVSLSRGGADAVEMREFDMETRQFVAGGFVLAESKQSAAWADADTLYVARDFGPGSMTRSGYPRIVKAWPRGRPLAEAKTLFEGREDDVGVGATVLHEPGRRHALIRRSTGVRQGETHLLDGDGKWVRLDVPIDADTAVFQGLLVLKLRSGWQPAATPWPQGSLIAIDLDRFLTGDRAFESLFEPRPRVSLKAYVVTRHGIVLDILDEVKARVTELRRDGGQWQRREVAVPPMASVSLAALDRERSDDYWLTVSSFVEPSTLYLARAGSDAREKVKALPGFFDAGGLRVAQFEARSRDGTRVPYFAVMREDLPRDGRNPTVLYGYGGFEVSQTPGYSAAAGVGWLEQGGVWVLANLRGGGEFGPEWHQAARREGRQRTHDDFIAVAEDLIQRRITSPAHLGIYGGSQGGLLVGAAFTQRPELFKAAVSTVPLLDMRRYHRLLAGASWMSEYGNPDEPGDWAFIGRYSPYQNVFKDRRYPKVLIATTTRDDRVHPGHARKMAAKMQAQGHEVLYFENTEGGHGAGSTPQQQAYFFSLVYGFFRQELGLGGPPGGAAGAPPRTP